MNKEGKIAIMKMELKYFKKKHQQMEILKDSDIAQKDKKKKLIKNTKKISSSQEQIEDDECF
jgi:hypothetical protein